VTNNRMLKKLNKWKPISTRFTGRPRIKWENDIKKDLK